jgi:hypothetical protein
MATAKRRASGGSRPEKGDGRLKVRFLDVVTYSRDGTRGRREIAEPRWEQIETAIRKLNRHGRPFIVLRLSESSEVRYLSILGGKGAYSLEGKSTGLRCRVYHDTTHSDQEIPIWTSDQGLYPPETGVCYDLDLVLKVARHYAETGKLDPSVRWKLL